MGFWRSAMLPRQASKAYASAEAQIGRVAVSGSKIQPTTASTKTVSRASRGSALQREAPAGRLGEKTEDMSVLLGQCQRAQAGQAVLGAAVGWLVGIDLAQPQAVAQALLVGHEHPGGQA